ncbi:sulfatase [Haladaptatus salinisoli]|uniref:sulfatase n=1 Tax=Haladaptatus salinisoli TaxID=2884876 RepID=UPI001D0B6391|nr:sulfatase [Haladaptatus salinisoli]
MTQLFRHLERIAVDRVPERIKPYLRTVRNRIKDSHNTVEYHRRLNGTPLVETNGKDVIIVVVDCLRADHTSLRDYERETTPFLSTLTGQYPHAISAAPWTYSSVSSILTGRYPHNHGALPQGEFRNFDDNVPREIDDDVMFLSELLGNAGYDTFALTSIGFADIVSQGRFLDRQYRHDADATTLVDELLEWWHSHESPRFAYLHLADLHEPLSIPNNQPFGHIEEVDGLQRWNFHNSTTPTEEFQHYHTEKVRLYDTLIRYVDNQLERLYENIGYGDNRPLVVITGDHGEEFWEHVDIERKHFEDPRNYYGIGHGHALFNEIVNVPLIIDHSDIEESSDDWVSLVDIAPTVLDALGANPQKEIDGSSLFLGNESKVYSEAVGYGYEKKMVIEDGYKLIHAEQDGVDLLYDLDMDDTEKQPIDDKKRKETLLEQIRSVDEKQGGSEIKIDKESKEHLQDLGYFE